jgi:hypothetical protein
VHQFSGRSANGPVNQIQIEVLQLKIPAQQF